MNTFQIQVKDGKPCALVVDGTPYTEIEGFIRKALNIDNHDAHKVATSAFQDCLEMDESWSNICGYEANRPLPTHSFWKSENDVKIAHAIIYNGLKAAHTASVEFLNSILPDGIYSVNETVEVSRSRR